MPLPSPNLDDRSHREIVEEVLRLIPQYCPEWTNHNPSDPGITLVELFAWMTETIIYRLNKVTDKTYLKLLDLLGVRLLPPQPALVHLSFALADGAASPQLVAAHTQVATEQTEESDAVIFETEADLWVHDVVLEACFSVAGDRVSDNTARLLRREPPEGDGPGPPPGPVDVFMGVNEVERFLYLGDSRFGALAEAAKVHVKFDCPHARRQEFTSLLEWDYWNGRRWRGASTRPYRAEDGGEDPNRVVFAGPLEEMAPVEVDGREDCWLRARLIEVPQDDGRTLLGGVSASVEVLEEGMAPEFCLANFGSSIFVPVDQSKSFLPFGEEPRFDNTFYVAAPGCFSRADTRIRLEVALTASSSVERPRPSADLRLVWEFYDGKRWQELGTSTPEGPVAAGHDFDDGTGALSRDGTVSFLRPAAWQPTEVNGEESWWLRVRIFEGDYGAPGRYVQSREAWVWKDDRPLAPPSVRELRIKYAQVPFAVERVLSYNDFAYRDHSAGGGHPHARRAQFQPFEPQKEENPALYLGFQRSFPPKDIRIYLRLEEEPREEREGPEFHLDDEPGGEPAEGRADQRVVWEYWNGKAWTPLHADDQTRHFAESGYLGFAGPRDHAAKREFGIEHYWLRARLEMGSYSRPPRLEAVLLDTVPAINAVTIRNEVLGSSDGSPDQAFPFAYAPVLEGPEVHVREPEPPVGRDREALEGEEGEEAIQVTRDEAGEVQEVWVRWHPVDSFYGSGPRSRHYVFEAATRLVRFGDGRRGMVPPSGQDNVRATRYQCGGGREGNVGAGSLTVLKRSLAY
ncbi:MAG: hypothetical protein HY722_10165, partial [Planctomycetes bacterium]|nr:hypothetical protein [Planctomycetota bacterium]